MLKLVGLVDILKWNDNASTQIFVSVSLNRRILKLALKSVLMVIGGILFALSGLVL